MRTIRTPEKRSEFLAALETSGGNVTDAAKTAGFSRRAAYEWREDDAEFAAEWDEAVEAGTDQLEQEARRRAYEGVDEPVFYQGAECGTVRKYSDTLLIFLLKGRRPEKYRERVQIDVNKLDADIERELAAIAAGGQTGSSSETESETLH